MNEYSAPQPQGSVPETSTGIEPNLSALLCYLFGFISGLVFWLIEKRNQAVRFHAAQSMIIFGALAVFWILLTIITSALIWSAPALVTVFSIIGMLVGLAALAGWILLMVFAYQGKQLEIPMVGKMARQLADKAPN